MNNRILALVVGAQLAAGDVKEKVVHSTRTRKGKALLLLGMAAGLLMPDLASAAIQFGEIGRNIGNNANGMTYGAHMFFVFLGWVMAGIGVLMGFTAHKKHEPATNGILTFLAGVVIISLTAIIGSGSSTIFGSDTSATPLSSVGVSN